MTPLLEIKSISKCFGAVNALHKIDFQLNAGEVVAIVGDNGAGKSSLIKVLSGLHRPDSGSLTVQGHTINLSRYNVRHARKLGIETVYQERSLGEKQPLWRNLFVGRHLRNRFGFIRAKEEKAITRKLLADLGLRGVGIDAESDASVLSGGERQGLAIGRAIHFDSRIIILDEPTNALSIQEVAKVLHFIRQIRASGRSCILICHNLAQAFEVADRFVFIERGQLIGERKRDQLSLESLSQLMIRLAQQGHLDEEFSDSVAGA